MAPDSSAPLHPAILAVGDLGRIAAVPWKNEGGQTRELWVEPPAASFADFVWRASVADVGRDGDFSTFAGIDRTIVLLEGDGFTMQAGDQQVHDLRQPFAPYRFDGETDIAVRLHGTPTLDFNLMVRRARATGELRVLRQSAAALPDDTVLLYVAQGSVRIDGLAQDLRQGQFVRLGAVGKTTGAAQLPALACAPGAVALAICIRSNV